MAKPLFSKTQNIVKGEGGFVFLTVTMLGSILFAAALSYVDLMVGQARIIRGSQNQLEAQAAAEAGLEDVAWECSYNGQLFLSGNGWTTSGSDKTKTVTWTNTSGTSVGSYTTTVSDWSGNNPSVTVVGTSSSSGASTSSTMKALLAPRPMFNDSITAAGTITLGGNAYTDSYNSSSGAYGGSNRATSGSTSTNSTSTGAISLSGNAQVKGNAGVGTGGTVTVANHASVLGSTTTGVANTIASNTVPSGLSALSSSGTIALTGSTTQTLTAGSYKYTSISTSGSSNLRISGNVTLYLTGTSSIANSGTSGITINSGSSLTVYFDGSISVSGNGFVNNNGSANPTTFQMYGTSTATSITISGNGNTSGVISAPNANIVVSGNGDIYGSVIANSFTGSGNGGFHYDENLATTGPASFYKLRWVRRTS